MKGRRVYGVELFSRGFAGKLHKRVDAAMFGPHGQPRKDASAAGRLGTMAETKHVKASMKAKDAAKSAQSRGKRPNPAQLCLKL